MYFNKYFPKCSGGAVGAAVELLSAAVGFCGAAVVVRCIRHTCTLQYFPLFYRQKAGVPTQEERWCS